MAEHAKGFDRPIGNVLIQGSYAAELNAVVASLKPSTTYADLMQEQFDHAADVDAMACSHEPDLAVLIGLAINDMIVERGISLQECMRRWDKNQDGQFSKNEFRAGVRAPINSAVNFGLGVVADVSALDTFFEETVAEDKTLLVTRSRMLTVLKKLHASALAKKNFRSELTAKATELRRRGERAKEIMELTMQGEYELAGIQRWEGSASTEARVAIEVVKRQMKVHTLRTAYGDQISRKAWTARLTADLAVDISLADAERLFDQFDLNSDGALDLHEIKRMLKRLTAVALDWQVQKASRERLLVKQLRLLVKAQKAYTAECNGAAVILSTSAPSGMMKRRRRSLASRRASTCEALASVRACLVDNQVVAAQPKARGPEQKPQWEATRPGVIAPGDNGLTGSTSSSLGSRLRSSIRSMWTVARETVNQASLRVSSMHTSLNTSFLGHLRPGSFLGEPMRMGNDAQVHRPAMV